MSIIGDKCPTYCPACGAAIGAHAARCWLCGHVLAGAAGSAAQLPIVAELSAKGEQAAPHAERGKYTFSLATLMLLVTLASILFGIMAAAPGLGILLAVLAVPALVRASAMSARQREVEAKMSPSQTILNFAASAALVLAVAVAAAAAFFATCFVGCLGIAALQSVNLFDNSDFLSFGLIVLLAGSALAGLVLGGYLLHLTWPRQR